jgi:hypothetical protein
MLWPLALWKYNLSILLGLNLPFVTQEFHEKTGGKSQRTKQA